MSFEEPTYEEYRRATAWAKFKYKYGIIVMILCWILLIFIAYYMFTNGQALSTNPLIYGAEKYNVECYCYKSGEVNQYGLSLYFNSTNLFPIKIQSRDMSIPLDS